MKLPFVYQKKATANIIKEHLCVFCIELQRPRPEFHMEARRHSNGSEFTAYRWQPTKKEGTHR